MKSVSRKKELEDRMMRFVILNAGGKKVSKKKVRGFPVSWMGMTEDFKTEKKV